MQLIKLFTLCLMLLCTGCYSVTPVAGPALSENNFKVLKPHVSATSYGFRLLGFLPVLSPSVATAHREIYESIGESVEGRSIALTNQVEERSVIYLVAFSIPQLTVTADIIEFTDSSKK